MYGSSSLSEEQLKAVDLPKRPRRTRIPSAKYDPNGADRNFIGYPGAQIPAQCLLLKIPIAIHGANFKGWHPT